MTSPTTAVESLLRRDRLIISLSLLLICLLSWWYVLAGAGTGMSTLAMTTWQFPPPAMTSERIAAWGLQYWLIMALMWWVMMIAMMVPSAAPMILLYARVYRHAQKKGQIDRGLVPTAAFSAGYLLAWLVFSLVATVLQWGLEQLGLLHSMLMWSTSHSLSAAFLIAAGIYQLSPLKNSCLTHCRTPVDYISRNWRPDSQGALTMGWRHGLYCVGCCWFLMALLFVGGIMNLVWIAGLAVFVLLEKLAPQGYWVARVSGLVMIVVGVYLYS
jgi:predicted metal-binding membrane protein